jgi:hypothetical protein
MSLRTLIPLAAALAAAACVAPAAATMYKWVDDRGVTNYSNVPPPDVAAREGAVVSGAVSVYTPDPALKRATDALRARMLNDLATGRREREAQSDWLARQYLSAMQPTYADPCAENPAACSGYPPAYGYGYGIPSYARRGGVRILPQIQLTPGVTAGNVTGNAGYIPGNSAFAPPSPFFSPHVKGYARTPERLPAGGTGHGGGHRGR